MRLSVQLSVGAQILFLFLFCWGFAPFLYFAFTFSLFWSLFYSWLGIVCFVFNSQSLFHRNTRPGWRAARVLVGLGQNRLFPCLSEIPREGYFTIPYSN